jgi:hypothetical protein
LEGLTDGGLCVVIGTRDLAGDAKIVSYLVGAQLDKMSVSEITPVRLCDCASARAKSCDTVCGLDRNRRDKEEHSLWCKIVWLWCCRWRSCDGRQRFRLRSSGNCNSPLWFRRCLRFRGGWRWCLLLAGVEEDEADRDDNREASELSGCLHGVS